MKKLSLLVLVSLFLTAGVCEMVPNSESIKVDDLYGKYKANFHSGLVDEIEIIKEESLYIGTYNSF